MKNHHYFLHDRLVPAAEAHLHPADRGFRFGDGVFDTIRIHRGVPVFWPLHWARLQEGLRALGIPLPNVDMLRALRDLLDINEVQDGMLRIAISRGVGSQGYLPLPSAQPTLVIETIERPAPPSEPLSLWLSAREKPSPRALPVHLKLAQGVNSMLARMEAQAEGCDEALQLNAQGELCEASAANLFWFKDAQLYTPALPCGVLAGVTRAVVLNLAEVQEVYASLDALEGADGVFLTNASIGLQPCTVLEPMGWHWPVPDAFHALKTAYTQVVERAAEEQTKQW